MAKGNPNWVPGTSGNPKGRPPKSVVQAFRDPIQRAMPEIIAKVVEAALEGDMAAIKLLMDRCVPVLKAVDSPIPMALGNDLASASTALLQALSQGELTPDQGAAMATALAALAKVQEISDLAGKVAALQEAAAAVTAARRSC